MRQEDYWQEPHDWNQVEDDGGPEDYVRGSSERARQRALSLYLIRSIVEKHGGNVQIDLATDTINIDVPKEEEIACAQEIEKQVGSMCC
jgi:hypothetical protein